MRTLCIHRELNERKSISMIWQAIKSLFCKHDWVWVRDFYGDGMRANRDKGSQWACICGRVQFRDERHEAKLRVEDGFIVTASGRRFPVQEANGF